MWTIGDDLVVIDGVALLFSEFIIEIFYIVSIAAALLISPFLLVFLLLLILLL